MTRAQCVGFVATVMVSAAVAGCGSAAAPTEPNAPGSSTPGATLQPPTGPSSPAPTASSAPTGGGTVVDINIAAGAVTPTNGEAQAKLNQPIVLKVNSDVSDQLHVHSVPEHTFQVAARANQTFEFTVEVPGQVDVELHDLDRKVVTIQVRP